MGFLTRKRFLVRALISPPFHCDAAHGTLTETRMSSSSVRIQTALRAHLQEAELTMPTLMIFHEVDNVEHWLGSPKREEVFGPLGITVRTFVDPMKTNHVGLIVDVPDMDAFQRVMESGAAADAMKFDGVRPETILMLVES